MVTNGLGGILADDMGLGKTVQIIGLLTKLKKDIKINPALIVCPKSLVYNWQSEINKFFPDVSVGIFQKSDLNISFFKKHQIIIISYPQLRSEIENLLKNTFTMSIFDEAHTLKNPKAQVTSCALLINAKYKIALTGTPIENSIYDLVSILNIVNPGLINKQDQDRWAKETDFEKLKSFSKGLKPFILRRTNTQ